jgi:hypothetical protein
MSAKRAHGVAAYVRDAVSRKKRPQSRKLNRIVRDDRTVASRCLNPDSRPSRYCLASGVFAKVYDRKSHLQSVVRTSPALQCAIVMRATVTPRDLKAAQTRRPEDIVEATRCLEVALRRDHWL